MKRSAVLGAFLICVSLLVPHAAFGHAGDLFGLDMRAIALSNAYTALSAGPVSAFYNPAMVADGAGVQVEANYIYSLPSFRVDIDDPDDPNAENPGALDDAESVDAAQFIGAGVSGRPVDYVGLGLYMNMPISGLPQKRFFHAQEPYWLKYETGLQGLQIYPAIAFRIVPGVMIGLGATINVDNAGTIEYDVPLDQDTFAVVEGRSDWTAGASFNAGVFYRPFEFLQFGLVYRGENMIKQEQTFTLYPRGRNDGITVPVEMDVTTNYLPQQLAFGVVGKPFEWWRISVDVVYTIWSQYEPPFAELTVDYADLVENDIDFDEVRPLTEGGADVDFADVLTARIGLEFKPVQHFNVMAGYSYEPTPVPEQDGTTNILDADMHVVSLGFGVNFGGERHDLVRIDVSGQYHAMASRGYTKDIAAMDPYYQTDGDPAMNPGYPGFDFSGGYFVSGLSARFHF